MKLLLILLISLIVLIGSKTIVLGQSVTCIINPDGNNNNYQVGEICGNNQTNTCNSLTDAVAYFNTVKQIINPTSPNDQTYQPLTLSLMDGTYPVYLNSINVFQFNITIQSFTPNSKNVIIDSSIKGNPYTYFINSFPPNGTTSSNQLTTITITNEITFYNFGKYSPTLLDAIGKTILINSGTYTSSTATTTTTTTTSSSSTTGGHSSNEPVTTSGHTSFAIKNNTTSILFLLLIIFTIIFN